MEPPEGARPGFRLFPRSGVLLAGEKEEIATYPLSDRVHQNLKLLT